MGKTKIIFLDTFIENLASVSFFIESKGLPQTAILLKEKVYDFIEGCIQVTNATLRRFFQKHFIRRQIIESFSRPVV
jgi:hypothetical protein